MGKSAPRQRRGDLRARCHTHAGRPHSTSNNILIRRQVGVVESAVNRLEVIFGAVVWETGDATGESLGEQGGAQSSLKELGWTD